MTLARVIPKPSGEDEIRVALGGALLHIGAAVLAGLIVNAITRSGGG